MAEAAAITSLEARLITNFPSEPVLFPRTTRNNVPPAKAGAGLVHQAALLARQDVLNRSAA